jgi:hypothetical protein
MDHLDRLRGDYDEKLQTIEKARDALIKKINSHIPGNIMELIEADPDQEPLVDFGWVTVPDPVDAESDVELEVKPVFSLWQGEEGKVGPGIGSVYLFGKLPDGGERTLGTIIILSGLYKPDIHVNRQPDNDSYGTPIQWDDPDAEIFLTLSESVFDELDKKQH